MQFKATEPTAVIVYVDDQDATEWYTTDKIWYNIGDVVDVDQNFGYVVEALFTQDLLEGKFKPFDQDAEKFLQTLLMETYGVKEAA